MEFIKGKQKVADVKAKSERDEVVERYKEYAAGKSTAAAGSPPLAPRATASPGSSVYPVQSATPAPTYPPEPHDPGFSGAAYPYQPALERVVHMPFFEAANFHAAKPAAAAPSSLPLDKASAYTATRKSDLMPTHAAPAASVPAPQPAAAPPSPPYPWLDTAPSTLQAPMPARTADHEAVAAGMGQLTTAPEHPAPLINPDWSINHERADPAVVQFQRDLQNYKDHVREYMVAKAKAETASAGEAADLKEAMEGAPEKKPSQDGTAQAASAEEKSDPAKVPQAPPSSFMASRMASAQAATAPESPFVARDLDGTQRDPATGWTKNQAKLMAPMPARAGTEPILFKVPESASAGPIATSIRDKVDDMYKSEEDKKKAKAEADVEVVKEAMDFARNVGAAE